MGYYVRLLSPSEQVIYFSEIQQLAETVHLTAGTDQDWTEIRIAGPSEVPVAILNRLPVSDGAGRDTLVRLKSGLFGTSPVSAREWINKYLGEIKTIYAFQLLTENLTTDAEWRTLGYIQNLLKDNLGGIIQSDQEGYFNENGDYILWQMYSGAQGSVPAATLNENGQWTPFQLRLGDKTAVERFKQGQRPYKGFLDLIFRK
ncbi:MAG TPA: hypothetical protein VLH15_07525 [Dehalococcoidales bacterium]|nr:hypothetical protein [Dehalococcoidales bacterium]